MAAIEHGYEGIAKLLLARPEIQVNLVNSYRWSALMMAAAEGHQGIVKLLLSRPETLVNSVDNEGCSALVLATLGRHEAIVGLLLNILHINTETRCTDDLHMAISLALANGDTRIIRPLEEFESWRATTCPGDLTLQDV
ncbi:ankyrin repeat-containing domain protein [Coprinopsis sp. MPI-PUGE-AT-0042]|nr:ankyrin repeat-containing domain protein [Coprinopsis sp. MPI-PUGE-AT-0042]